MGGLVGDVLQPPACARPWTASYMVPALQDQEVPCEPELGSRLGQGRGRAGVLTAPKQEGTLGGGEDSVSGGTKGPEGPT